MSVDPNLFRQVMSRFASGVTVVTTLDQGRPSGLTVSSFASLSLTPTLALVCLDNGTRISEQIVAAGGFAINILADDQELLSRHFASPQKGDWGAIDWAPGPAGLPLLNGALARMECSLAQTLPGGDHTIYVGELTHAEAADAAPLLYYRGGYHALPA
ncbi:MAG TPA: flavin reductase family protein [Herpetosiphonaceae bacterium]